jgi:hypothetical protein
MLVSDPWLVETLGERFIHGVEVPAEAACAAFVVGLGFVLSRRAASQDSSEQEI